MTCPIFLELHTGAKMPAIGYGTSKVIGDDAEVALDAALETGYRHIDTARVYENEQVIGKVLRKWLDSGKIKREDLFIVTKLPSYGNHASSVEKYLKESLKRLQLDYVDLYLVHSPFGYLDTDDDVHQGGPGAERTVDYHTDLIALWKAMEAQVDAGLTKAIGVSNFNEWQIQRILDSARIKPANLQMEFHAYHQQKPLVEFCKKNNITVVAYSPLGRSGSNKLAEALGGTQSLPDLVHNETALKIGNKYNKTAVQVLLRHILQSGLAAIPRSVNPGRIQSNFQVFDFELDDSDMEALNKLDQGGKARLFHVLFSGPRDHPEYPF